MQLKKDYVDLKKSHKLLTKQIKSKQSRIDSEKRKCNEVQFLKYGRTVPLEVLDRSHTNSVGLELEQKLQEVQNQARETYGLWVNKIERTKQNLRQETENNTVLLCKCALLTKENHTLNTELNSLCNLDVIEDSTPNDHKRNQELQELVNVAKTQASQIDILKAEIHMLQRKGETLYSVP